MAYPEYQLGGSQTTLTSLPVHPLILLTDNFVERYKPQV